MNSNSGGCVFRLLISLFFGVTVVGIGLGVVITPLVRIAAPFVCPRGDFMLESEMYSYKPGQTGITRTWFCVENTNTEPKDVSIGAMVVAGIIYGIIIFILWTILFRGKSQPGQIQKVTETGDINQILQNSNSVKGRLQELQTLYDSGLITQQEYEEKRLELIKQI